MTPCARHSRDTWPADAVHPASPGPYRPSDSPRRSSLSRLLLVRLQGARFAVPYPVTGGADTPPAPITAAVTIRHLTMTSRGPTGCRCQTRQRNRRQMTPPRAVGLTPATASHTTRSTRSVLTHTTGQTLRRTTTRQPQQRCGAQPHRRNNADAQSAKPVGGLPVLPDRSTKAPQPPQGRHNGQW